LVLLVTSIVLAAQEAPPMGTADMQKECPVMVGSRVDPNLFTVYQGKKVYFCCASCKEAFEAHPERYLARLPQFAAPAAAAPPAGTTAAREPLPGTPEETGSREFRPGSLIAPLGIAAFGAVAATVLTGLLRKLRPRFMLKLHKVLGVIALIVAAFHGSIVILLD
jgi:YHS domain-containing protein